MSTATTFIVLLSLIALVFVVGIVEDALEEREEKRTRQGDLDA